MCYLDSCPRRSEWRWFIFTKKKATKKICLKLPISTVRDIIRKWKINGTVEIKARPGSLRKCSDRMNSWWEILRRTNTTAKELQKRVAATGLAVHRTTIQCILNNKDLHGRVARKKPFLRPQNKIRHLKYAKENIKKHEALGRFGVTSDETQI